MNQIELLKRLPKEHWTEHNGKAILIKDLLAKLEKENDIRHKKRKVPIRSNDSRDNC